MACPFGTCADKTSLEAILATAIRSVYCDSATPPMQMRHIQGHRCNLTALAKTWSQPSCPSGGRLLPTLQYNHITEYYTATKKHTAVLFPEWTSRQGGVHSILPLLHVVHEKVYAEITVLGIFRRNWSQMFVSGEVSQVSRDPGAWGIYFLLSMLLHLFNFKPHTYIIDSKSICF